MKTQKIFQEDSYQKEFDAKVLNTTDDKFILLDKTLFYAASGGQAHDTGRIRQRILCSDVECG